MRLLILTNLYPPAVLGGYELLARDVAQVLAQRGHHVEVLTTGGTSGSQRITRTLRLARPFGQPAHADRVRHLLAAVQNRRAMTRYLTARGRPDAVLVMSLRRLGLAPLRVLLEARVPAVLTVNDDWPVAYCPPKTKRGVGRRLLGPVDRHLFAFKTWRGLPVERVIFLSETIRRIVADSGAPFPTGVVQPQGIDLSLFAPRPFRPMRPHPELLYVGRLHPTKAPDVAIDSLAALVNRGLPARLTLVGPADDRTFHRTLLERVARLGLSDRVRWLGPVPRHRLPDIYRSADLFLFPSRLEHEGQGLTYLEAMACGIPVVAFPCGGAREFLDHHPAVVRARTCAGDAFADETLALYKDEARQADLVASALRVVRDHASLDAYVDLLEEHLCAAAQQDSYAHAIR